MHEKDIHTDKTLKKSNVVFLVKSAMGGRDLLCDESLDVSTSSPIDSVSSHVSYNGSYTSCTYIPYDPLYESLQILLHRETLHRMYICPNYIDTIQKDGMEENWRTNICSWMFTIGEHIDIPMDVILSSIHYMDQYLSKKNVNILDIQLLALTCVFMSSKIHLAEPLPIEVLSVFFESTFSTKLIHDMEKDILQTIQWKLHTITSYEFVHLIVQLLRLPCGDKVLKQSKCILEQIHTEYIFISYKNSTIAYAAIQLALLQYIPTVQQIQRVLDTFKKKDDISSLSLFGALLPYNYTPITPITPFTKIHPIRLKKENVNHSTKEDVIRTAVYP